MENKSKKRRRRSKRSSSSHSSVEVTTTAFTTATTVSSSSSKGPSREEAAIAMATVLASELRPEHKLPSREILVQPQPKFMELLETVGAKGPMFTARQVLSYLIKYISSRQLYVQQDPKRVYCEKDPLGKVFGVNTFTIKDARKLLFENMSVLREAPDYVTQHHDTFQRQQRKLYYTFHQSQQTTPTDAARPTAPVPVRSATAPSTLSMPSTTPGPSGVGTKGCFAVKREADSEDLPDSVKRGPFNSTQAYPVGSLTSAQKDLPVPVFTSTECKVHVTESVKGSTCNSTSSSIKQPVFTPVRTQKVLKTQDATCTIKSASATVATSLSSMTIATGKKRLISDSSEDCSHISSCRKSTSVSGCERVGSRPWYCMLYHPSEELKSQSSEVLSIQDCETAIVADSSDDLWFVDEDELTPLEYDVPSDSSDDYTIIKGSSDDSSSDTELVFNVLLRPDESGDSHFADNSDDDTTDTEISDMDKWQCAECSMRNSPVERYCSRCWALRKGWLPDNQRMTLKERLQNSNRPLRRSFSAPAGNVDPPSLWYQTQTTGHFATDCCSNESRPISIVFPEAHPQTNPMTNELSTVKPRTLRDFPDGINPDMPDGKTSDEDEAGTGLKSSQDGKMSVKRKQSSEDDSQDTIIVANDLPLWKRMNLQDDDEAMDSVQQEFRPSQSRMQDRRDDSGIGLTQESTVVFETPLGRASQGETVSAPRWQPRKRHRSASASNLHKGFENSSSQSKKFHFGDTSVLQVGLGPHLTSVAGKSDPGAGPSSSQSTSVVTKHYNDLCIICYSRPKTASIIHGRTGHQVCCYPCAKKLHHRGKPCPVCRRSIQAVIKNFLL
ncbi:uncharacterized protein LOC117289503 [Asterias rubens]|uniref:uncharacterized protein LOC117289503 n=1 Tax=Asterias rubens TaxID=7604 RepID=UPI001455C5BE|nr:uncharacterized protein LOC117289503 [Asterias rubens]